MDPLLRVYFQAPKPEAPHFKTPNILNIPRGSINTPIMELGSRNHNRDGLLGPNSIMVVYMEPLGYKVDGRQLQHAYLHALRLKFSESQH